MNDSTQKRILNTLLDKYERSSSYRTGEPSARRIILHFYDHSKSDFPYYDIERSDRRISVNRAVEELYEKKLLCYDWLEVNHIVAKVWLNLDNLSLAYEVAGRQPKSDIVDIICSQIEEVKKNLKSAWACQFLRDAYDEMIRRRSTVAAIPIDDKEREYLFQAITAIDQMDGEFVERILSMRIFGDSKRFERSVRSRLLGILRRYMDNDDDATDEDVLKQVGIVRYPENFEFCGNITVLIDKQPINYGFLLGGGIIYSSDLACGTIAIAPSINTVITIENRANYLEYVKKTRTQNELVVYHAGQYSPRKRVFLQTVARELPEHCKWYHWSDIDYGGFLMLLRIRQEITTEALPYRMNTSELERYRNFATSFGTQYAGYLESLKYCSELSDCFGCIDYMLENRIRLEQEAMLIV